MASVQFALAVSEAAPYTRMLKFTDGVPSIDATFPAMATPIPLDFSDFCPTGDRVVAVGAASSLTPMRMWALDTTTLAWKEVAVAALPNAVAAVGVLFIGDNDIILFDGNTAGTSGLWMGAFDRSTNTITWSTLDPTLKGVFAFYDMTTAAGVLRFGFNRSANGTYRFYSKASGSWAFVNSGITNTAACKIAGFSPVIDAWIRFRNGVVGYDYARVDPSTYAFTNTATDVTGRTSDSGKIVTRTDPTWQSCKWSPPGRHFFYSVNEAPYLRCFTCTNTQPNSWPRTISFGDQIPGPAFNGPLFTMDFLNKDFMLVACMDNTQSTGRVRGFTTVSSDEMLVEDTRVSALFNDWSAVIQWIACSPAFTGVGSLSLYNSALAAVLNDTINLTSLKLALVSASGVFDPSQTTLAAALGANEVYAGTSWPQGGIACGSLTEPAGPAGVSYLNLPIPAVTINDNVSLVFRYAVIYDNADAGKKPLAWIDTGATQTVVQFDKVQFAASGDNIVTLKSVNA